jgi:hypothetical protein
MQTAGYVEILRKLHLFFGLCETLDLRNQAELGRFGIYEGRIRHLISNIEAIQRGVPEGPLFAKIAPELPIFMAALSEAFEVGEMTTFLRNFPKEVLESRLKLVVQGPVLPSDEDQASNQARNIQFELALATILAQSGMSITFAEPDLRCEVNGLTFFIACKRIVSPRRLNKRINEATNQLRRELAPFPEAGGVIAISLSSVLATADGKSETIASQADGLKTMQTRIDTFVARHGARWQKTREAQGILFHVSSMFTNNGTGRVELGGFTVMHGTGPIVEAIATGLAVRSGATEV